MASEYTTHRRYPLYTDQDKPNLRDQYNGAIRMIDSDVDDALDASGHVSDALGAGFDLQHTVRMAIESLGNRLGSGVTEQNTATDQLNDKASQTDLASETEDRQQADTSLSHRLGAGVTEQNSATAQFASLNTKLGSGITEQNTATAQLAQKASTNDLSEAVQTLRDELATKTALEDAISGLNTSKLNKSTFENYLSSNRYIICIGNSWIAPAGQPDGGHGNDLKTWLNTLYGITAKVYGRGGAGWLRTGTQTGQTIMAAVDEAIEDVANNLLLAACCTDIFLLEMQNDQEYFVSGIPSGYANTIRTAITNLRSAFPFAKIHYIMDNAKSTTLTQYTTFNNMLRTSFSFSPIRTAFLIPSNGYRDSAHLANSYDGYGRLAKAIMSYVCGEPLEYPWIAFNQATSSKIASLDMLAYKGDPFAGIYEIGANLVLNKAEVAENDYDIAISPNDTYLNKSIICGRAYNVYIDLRCTLSYLNFKDAHLFTVAGDETPHIWLAPEMANWISTLAQSNPRFVGFGVAQGFSA